MTVLCLMYDRDAIKVSQICINWLLGNIQFLSNNHIVIA